jgi:hypothetical protein
MGDCTRATERDGAGVDIAATRDPGAVSGASNRGDGIPSSVPVVGGDHASTLT